MTMRDLLGRIENMPVSITIMLVWIVMWVLAVCKINVLSALAGKGAAQIGKQYYRYFTGWLLHKHIVHLLANVSALFWIGLVYENHTGSVRFLLVGLICAVLCAIVLSFIYRNASECIGGSSFTYALLGFGLTMQFLVPGSPKLALGTWSGNWLLVYAIASNFPFRISILPFVDVATIVTHVIAFALGAIAALGCRLLGMR